MEKFGQVEVQFGSSLVQVSFNWLSIQGQVGSQVKGPSWVQVGVILGLSSILLAISSVSSRESSQGQVRGPVRVKSGQVGVKSGSSRGQVGVKSGSFLGQYWSK